MNGCTVALSAVLAYGVAAAEESPKPAVDASPARVAKLLRDLDAADFKVREAANAELLKMGAAGLKPLKAVLQGEMSREVRSRVEQTVAAVETAILRATFVGGAPVAGLRAILRCDKLEFAAGEPPVFEVEYRAAGDAPARFVPVKALAWETPGRAYYHTGAQAIVEIKQLSGDKPASRSGREACGSGPDGDKVEIRPGAAWSRQIAVHEVLPAGEFEIIVRYNARGCKLVDGVGPELLTNAIRFKVTAPAAGR